MLRKKPERIEGIKIRGRVLECEGNKWFKCYIDPKSRDLREDLSKIRDRVQMIENEKDTEFRQSFRGAMVHLVYLNWESAKGLYKDSKNNLPYEIINLNGRTIYRRDKSYTKEYLLNQLEELAVEEGLKTD